MRLRTSGLALLLAVLVLPATVVAGSVTSESGKHVQAGDALQVRLKGPFGSVPGSDRASPAGALPDDTPLDAWTRRAPLVLEYGTSSQDVLELAVVVTGLGDDEASEILSQGATAFAGPDAVGTSVVVATVTLADGDMSEYAWLLEVPDRAPSEEALFDIVGPDVLLSSAAGVATGTPGHGCYAYLCVEAGRRPPAMTLMPLRVGVGETPSLRLSDGSAMAGWSGTLTRIDVASDTTRDATSTATDAPAVAMDLHALEVPDAGEWWLELRVDYDRDRGWQWFFYRLRAE